jgi:hypothetical protein
MAWMICRPARKAYTQSHRNDTVLDITLNEATQFTTAAETTTYPSYPGLSETIGKTDVC